MDEILNSISVDRTTISVAPLGDDSDDRKHWANACVEDRWAAMEFLRVLNYGFDPATERLQRVFTVIDLKSK